MISTPCKRKNKKSHPNTPSTFSFIFALLFVGSSSTTFSFARKKAPKRKIYKVSTIPKENQEEKRRENKCQDVLVSEERLEGWIGW
jgi:hypothetical protein